MDKNKLTISQIRHPSVITLSDTWYRWRMCYEGGDDYVTQYLKKFSNRELTADYNTRKDVTPIPTFAKAAVNDIRNSIFQRMTDIIRRGGSPSYMKAVAGDAGGVDLHGTTMSAFMGIDILTELLVMGQAGIFVDMPQIQGPTLADVQGSRPYLYSYRREDILSWEESHPGELGQFRSVLLRDYAPAYQEIHEGLSMPIGGYERYRLVWRDERDGKIYCQFYDAENNPTDPYGQFAPDSPVHLDLPEIPFILLDIGDSLLADVYKHQIALLNLTSSDISYALKANFPFYVEQQDFNRTQANHLKPSQSPGNTGAAGDQRAADNEITTGAAQGRAYDLKAEAPQFIHPSSEPLKASMQLQEKLEDEIRKLVNLAVANKVGSRSRSAEAMKLSDQGLEAGLSFIGLVLEGGEQKIARNWAHYEDKRLSAQQVATVKYPDRYSLKTDKDRIEEAKELVDLTYTVPGQTVKRELQKIVVTKLLNGKIDVDTMDAIFKEIDASDYTTSDPQVIIQASQAGLCGEKVASMALGFGEDEYKQARKDHAARIARIQAAQSGPGDAENAAARGVDDLAADPQGGKEERSEATDTTMKDSTKPPVRGKGKETPEEEEN